MNRASQFKAQQQAAAAKRKHRSRLISEIAANQSRNTDSIASSTGSVHGTVSPDSTQDILDLSAITTESFDPERDEALMSTLPMNSDFSAKLPQIRDTAKKCGRWAPRPAQPSYVIDTSALGRAFPDFTGGGTSSDDDLSRELGRGPGFVRKEPRHKSNQIYVDNSNQSNQSSKILTTTKTQVQSKATTSFPPTTVKIPGRPVSPPTNTNLFSIRVNNPPSFTFDKINSDLVPKSSPPPTMNRVTEDSTGVFDKENIAPAKEIKPLAPISSYVSNASRLINGKRRPLHARVESDKDTTFNSTRSKLQLSPARSEPPKPSPLRTFTPLEPVPNRRRANSDQTKGTNPSFFIPGQEASSPHQETFDLGLPVTVSKGRVQHRNPSSRQGHYGQVDNFDLPSEEVDIYKMCDDQKIKIAELEQYIKTLEAHSIKSNAAEVEYQVQQRHWAKHKCVDDELVRQHARLTTEHNDLKEVNSQLENSLNDLDDAHNSLKDECNALEEANRRLEYANRSLLQEKNSWESHGDRTEQLEIEIADLKIEKAQYNKDRTEWEVQQYKQVKLEEENARLKQTWESHKCADHGLQREIMALRTEKRAWEKTSHRGEKLEKENSKLRQDLDAQDFENKLLEQEISQLKHDKEAHVCNDKFQQELTELKRGFNSLQVNERELKEKNAEIKRELSTAQAHKRDLQEENAEIKRELHMWESHKCEEHAVQSDNGSERRSTKYKQMKVEKSIIKEKYETLKTQYETLEKHYNEAKQQQGAAGHGANGGHGNGSGRSRNGSGNTRTTHEEMTSAFLLPDITQDDLTLGDEPTLRPTMGPSPALARVMKAIRNEIDDLRKELAVLHEKYQRHQSALSKRDRERTENKIKNLVDAISGKSEQLYYLHDVELSLTDETRGSLPWEGIPEE